MHTVVEHQNIIIIHTNHFILKNRTSRLGRSREERSHNNQNTQTKIFVFQSFFPILFLLILELHHKLFLLCSGHIFFFYFSWHLLSNCVFKFSLSLRRASGPRCIHILRAMAVLWMSWIQRDTIARLAGWLYRFHLICCFVVDPLSTSDTSTHPSTHAHAQPLVRKQHSQI